MSTNGRVFPLSPIMPSLPNAKTGNYYQALHNFSVRVIGAWRKWLSRRSQRAWISVEEMNGCWSVIRCRSRASAPPPSRSEAVDRRAGCGKSARPDPWEPRGAIPGATRLHFDALIWPTPGNQGILLKRQEALMERRAKVELFEHIRREYEFGVGTISGVARRLGVHRRMVRQALADARPPDRKRAERQRPVLNGLMPFIEGVLEADRKAPRKQRHTAHRIWQRIKVEMPDQVVAESTIREYVRERKRELGWSARATCVPQAYALGQEGQVDWYEAWAELCGVEVPLQVFSMRSMASGAAFHRAYYRATQQAFLEGHEHAFTYFGGVFRTLRYKDGRANPRQSHALKAPRIPAANAPNRLAGIDPQSSRPGHTTALPQMDQRPRSFGA